MVIAVVIMILVNDDSSNISIGGHKLLEKLLYTTKYIICNLTTG